jgi:general secretion pathway protein D
VRDMTGRLTAAFVALTCALTVAFAMLPHAALAAPPRVTTMSAVEVSDGAPGEVKVLLTFSKILPQFDIQANDTDKPDLTFAASTAAHAIKLPTGAHGLLTGLTVDEKDGVLTVRLSGAKPLHVTATPATTRSMLLVIAAAPPPPIVSQNGSLPAYNERAVGDDNFEVVPLKYADVSEVVGLLTAGLSVKSNDSFNPQEPAFGSAGMTGAAPAPSYNAGSALTADAAVGQNIDTAIGIDRRLNAVILRGSPEQIRKLKEKIAKIDVPITSVILETVFVELTESGARNVGLDFNNTGGQIGVASFQSGSFASSQSGSTKGVTSVSLQAAIYAQVQKGHGRIVSKPRIAAQSGGSAKIITGDALPILTSIALSGVNAVSQQVQYVNVGVTLQIAPRVSDDGFVTSHVFCEVSSVTGFSQGYPTISQREASTSATVKDGESFVIGGLTQDSELSTDGKIPIAGDVPIAGELFKLHKSTKSKTELYIVVTPHIVHGDDPTASAVLRNAN